MSQRMSFNQTTVVFPCDCYLSSTVFRAHALVVIIKLELTRDRLRFVRYVLFVMFRSLRFVRYVSFVMFRSFHFVRSISFVTFRYESLQCAIAAFISLVIFRPRTFYPCTPFTKEVFL